MGEILNGLMEALRIAKRFPLSEAIRQPMPEREAIYTYDEHAAAEVGHLYYFRPANASPGPYRHQRHVEAIIDIADDGTLAGVELIDSMPPPPTTKPNASTQLEGEG